MRKRPGGTTTISGQPAQSRNIDPGSTGPGRSGSAAATRSSARRFVANAPYTPSGN